MGKDEYNESSQPDSVSNRSEYGTTTLYELGYADALAAVLRREMVSCKCKYEKARFNRHNERL